MSLVNGVNSLMTITPFLPLCLERHFIFAREQFITAVYYCDKISRDVFSELSAVSLSLAAAPTAIRFISMCVLLHRITLPIDPFNPRRIYLYSELLEFIRTRSNYR